jgi:hypothetical protein
MRLRIRLPLRHPWFPALAPTPVRSAKGICQALSGSFQELARASASGVRAEQAVFTLHNPKNPFLSDYERDLLWQTYQVPVFAMLLDRQGRLAAWECEAQDGMHVGGSWNSECLWVYRLLSSAAEMQSAPCECGRLGQRLRPAPRIIVPRAIPRPDPAPALETVSTT